MNIEEFLLARITEDEREANGHLGAEYYQDGLWPEECAKRVLTECEAKRAIVGEHPRDDDGFCYDSTTHMRGCKWAYPCPTIRALAAVYCDHPDYQKEWAEQA